MSKFREDAEYAGRYFRTFCRWVMLSTTVGVICGLIGSAFHQIVTHATGIRINNPWLIFLLPVGGLAIAWLYRVTGT